MTDGSAPDRLYQLCLARLCPALEKIGSKLDWNPAIAGPLDKLASRIAEDLLTYASKDATYWNDSWVIFLTPKISSAILKWDRFILEFVGKRCKNLRRVFFKWVAEKFDTSLLGLLPKSVCSVDFDGELYYRGRSSFPDFGQQSWLPEAEGIFRSLLLSYKKQHSLNDKCLVELHLGTSSVSADQLTQVLRTAPNIRLLRHYQLVSALYKLHSESWKSGSTIPTYKLNNLDADFSHVVRCRMSPQAVLPGDAMRLASQLCPDVASVRVRIDCSTPHDILGPLTSFKRLRELSVVCVTSGERCNLDFSDICPILEAHGETSLTSLELKVIEEVESHQIVFLCPRLEVLVLSGCGFVCPPTCGSFMCANNPRYLRKLKLLFYADGDDFSWTHNVPQCFWKAALTSGPTKKSRLSGLFLESPRITETTARELWTAGQTVLYPELRVVSLLRYSEITLDDVRNLTRGAPLKYLRATDCERLHSKRLRQMFTSQGLVICTS
ncbi:uncharacterized protein LOC129000875 isoform X2 [Macrosteles quadrilineatus]|uniref:uncharacterized protein LOC129000875 isoform X2 n=1 Tax=Macrosteles quadrilineatus TaxID=74068 RepID=UPI0023E1BCDE|nr:uncharacterized protein LOC129000875 isoform X2 [Macrosteles quadrilineatus]